jgi:hypothetical protein
MISPDIQQTALSDEATEALPASSSGKHAQAVQRLQVGIFGLLAMGLLVLLANVIMDRAKETEATSVPEASATTAPETGIGPVSDPLVDAGVVPDLPVGPANGAPATTAATPLLPPVKSDGAARE